MINNERIDTSVDVYPQIKDHINYKNLTPSKNSEPYESINDTTKIKLISDKFADIMKILGLDLTSGSLKDTPMRVAKMYVNEIFCGLDPKNSPEITLFKNTYRYNTPLLKLEIPFTSFCEHHFVPIVGKANIAYIPGNYVLGLSKFHRVVDYYARRPQVQERLTKQVFHALEEILQTIDIGVVMKASHSCISCRGVMDQGSSTVTSVFGGQISEDKTTVNVLLENR